MKTLIFLMAINFVSLPLHAAKGSLRGVFSAALSQEFRQAYMQRKVAREKFRSFLRQSDGYKQVVAQLDEIFAETGNNGHILQSELTSLLEGYLNISALPLMIAAFFALDDEQFATLVTRLAQDLDLAPMRTAYEEAIGLHDIDYDSSTQLIVALIRDADMEKVADGIGIWLNEPLVINAELKLGSLAGIVSRVRTIRELWSDQEVTADLLRLFHEIEELAIFTTGSDVPQEYYTLFLSQLRQLIEALFDNPNTQKMIGDIGFIVEGEEVDILHAKEFLLSIVDSVREKETGKHAERHL